MTCFRKAFSEHGHGNLAEKLLILAHRHPRNAQMSIDWNDPPFARLANSQLGLLSKPIARGVRLAAHVSVRRRDRICDAVKTANNKNILSQIPQLSGASNRNEFFPQTSLNVFSRLQFCATPPSRDRIGQFQIAAMHSGESFAGELTRV